MSQSPMELPRATVLSYLTPSSRLTPTRIRRVASWSTIGMGILHLLGAGLGGWVAYSEIEYWFRSFTWSSVVAKWGYNPELCYFLAIVIAGSFYLFVGGLMLFWLAHFVRRGRAGACMVATFFVGVMALLLLIASGMMGSKALLGPIWPTERSPDWTTLAWMPVALVLGLLVLIAKDLIGYLLWIRRNPLAEKAPVKFLP